MYAINPDVQWLIIRLICLIFFIAFSSLLVQVKGLFGPRGIQPLGLSNFSLVSLSSLGLISSIGGVIGWYPAPFILICWLVYLFFNYKDEYFFLNNHWDKLLLELGFYTIFYSLQSPASFYLSMVFPFFLFRFLLGAGMNKIFHPSRSDHWRNFSSMRFFYETQPLPNRIAYYLHKQPLYIAKVSSIFSLLSLFMASLLIFTPYSYISFLLIVFLQLGIWLSGNFPWINPLVIISSLTLLNIKADSVGTTFAPNYALNNSLNVIGLFFIGMNSLRLINDFIKVFHKQFFIPILSYFFSYHLFMPYSLFCEINEKRNVIIIEGSEDRLIWKEYEFKNNPGNIFRPPPQVTPHQNRLDWNMWDYGTNHVSWNKGWFVPFLACLLEGVPEVLNLIAFNPFPEKPPLFIRSKLYHYQFTDLETKRKTGQWWTRKFLRLFGHTYTLQVLSPSRKKLNRRPIIVK